MASKKKGQMRIDAQRDYPAKAAGGRHARQSMIPYAEYVILERALPRVEDGLKACAAPYPLLRCMELGNTPDKPYRKCARASWATAWVNITPTAIPRSTMRWCVWRSRFNMRVRADRRSRQLRLRGRRHRRRHAIHRGAHGAAGNGAAARSWKKTRWPSR